MSRAMPVKAYLVLWIRVVPELKIESIGVYSEPHPTQIDMTVISMPLLDGRGSTFDHAVENLKRYCRTSPRWSWAEKYLSQSPGSPR